MIDGQTKIIPGSRAAQILRTVHATPGISRVRLTRELGISSGLAADLVARLQSRRLVAESPGSASGRRGRPTLELGAHPQGPLAAVAVIGHETWTASIVELGGGIDRRLEGRHDRDVAAVCAEVRDALGEVCSPVLERVRAVAVSVPGTTTAEMLVEAPSLGWRDLDLAERLLPEDLRSRPFLLGNDANLAALGESRRGAATDIGTSLHIYMHSGIGGALISDGTLLAGGRGMGGEFGHLPFGPKARRCRCGALGCWNTLLDGAAFARGLGCSESDDEISLIASTLAAAAERPGRERVVAGRVGEALGRGIAGLVNALDPDAVILGGLAPHLLEVASDRIHAAYARGLMGTRSRDPAPLTAGSLGEEAPLVGAGERAFAQILGDLQARA
ncbi:MAG: ROK family transcriptional regulator [Solirubrobacteraceae bacterium]